MTMKEQPIFNQMNIVQIILENNGNFIALNPAAEHLFGISVAKLVGQPFITVLDPYSHERARLMVEKTLR